MSTKRRALVTGSTSGIGLGIAEALAAEGCNLMLNGFGEPETIENLRERLARECNVEVFFSGSDLSQPGDCAALVGEAEARMGGIDILVNNAGIQYTARVEDFPPDRWDAVLAINLSAAFHTVRCALPGMRNRGWGRIVNIASAHGLVASIEKAAYVAAKHGLIGLTKVVALETAESGITCNAICPGWVLTPLVQKQIDARAASSGRSAGQVTLDLLAEKQPTRRFTTVEQIGGMVAFLCGPAADNLTGASLSVDGGWTAQ
jgi:3-hydroxybutyrate dehydrogenase